MCFQQTLLCRAVLQYLYESMQWLQFHFIIFIVTLATAGVSSRLQTAPTPRHDASQTVGGGEVGHTCWRLENIFCGSDLATEVVRYVTVNKGVNKGIIYCACGGPLIYQV